MNDDDLNVARWAHKMRSERDTARAELAALRQAIEALCVTVENRMMATATASEIRGVVDGDGPAEETP